MFRKSTLIIAGLLALLVIGGQAQASPAARTHFVITGGTVTIALSSDLIDVLEADNAKLTASGGGVAVVTKTGGMILTLPVLGGLSHNSTIELASHCRCITIATRGTLVLTGNGKQNLLAKPVISFNGASGLGMITFVTKVGMQAPIQTSVVSLAFPRLPRSIAGTTFALNNLAGTVSAAGGGAFKGYVPYPGNPGNGVVPNYPNRAVAFGTVSIKLKLKPLP